MLSDPYFGLLTDPVGIYSQTSYGNTTAFTLRGSGDFLRKSRNLFESFSSDHGDRPLLFYPALHPDAIYFCATPQRIIRALRRYFYGQICRLKADKHVILDEEGDFVETVYLNELVMMEEATLLAETFFEQQIRVDGSGIPHLNESMDAREFSMVGQESFEQ